MWFEFSKELFSRRRTNRRRSDGRDPILQVRARASDRQRASRQRLGLVVLLLTLLAVSCTAFILVGRLLREKLFTQNPAFLVKQFDFYSDGKLQPWQIKEYAGIPEQPNLFALDLNQLHQNLLEVPLVKTVRIARRLPDTLEVRLTERTAVARLGRKDLAYPLAVDAEGCVLGPSAIVPNLPVISGVRDTGLRPGMRIQDDLLPDAIAILHECEQRDINAVVKVRRVDISNPEQIELVLESGENIYLARANKEDKLRQLALMLEAATRRGLALASIDLTMERNFPGKPR